MSNTSIPLVPTDLIVRVVKHIKSGKGETILKSLEATKTMPSSGIDVELVRRMVVISKLEFSQLTDRDRIWINEMGKVKKALLGVWQANVMLEAIVAYWIGLVSTEKIRDDEYQIYHENLTERINDGVLIDWLEKLVVQGNVNSRTTEPSR